MRLSSLCWEKVPFNILSVCAQQKMYTIRFLGDSSVIKELRCLLNEWCRVTIVHVKGGCEKKKEELALRQQELALQQKRQGQFEAQMLQQQQHKTATSFATTTAIYSTAAAVSTNSEFNCCFIAKKSNA